VSGWGEPPSNDEGQAPRSQWERPPEVETPGPGQLIRGAWQLYRANPRRFLAVAIVPELIRDLVAIPALAQLFFLLQGMVDVFSDYFSDVLANPERYQDADPSATQAALQEQIRAVLAAHDDLATMAAVVNGVGGAIALVGACMLVSAALAFADGRSVSPAAAFRQVAGRSGLVKPIVAIGVGWVAVSLLPLSLQSSVEFQAWAGTTGSPRSILLGSLLSVLALVVAVGAVFLAIRWALFIPAVLVEGLGVGKGLVRAAHLTRGIRIRLFLATAGIFILNGVSVGIAAVATGLAIWITSREPALGIATFLAVDLVGNLLWAPLGPAMLVVAYRERTDAGGAPVQRDELPG
jgi:hypothetical protein